MNNIFIFITVKDGDSCYSLQVFVVLTECVTSCWSDGIYLSSLVHRFWKLTLQVLIERIMRGEREWRGGRLRAGFPTDFWYSAHHFDSGFLILLQSLTKHPILYSAGCILSKIVRREFFIYILFFTYAYSCAA